MGYYDRCMRVLGDPTVCAVETRLKWLTHLWRPGSKKKRSLKLLGRIVDDLVAPETPDPRQELEASIKYEEGYINTIENAMLEVLRLHPVYVKYLSRIKGFGAATSAHILGVVPAWRFDKISKLWRYLNLAPEPPATQKSPPTKIMIRNAIITNIRTNGYYRSIYEHIAGELGRRGFSGGQLFGKAVFRTVKRFLQHYWVIYRVIMGLPLTLPYETAKGIEYPPPPAIDSPTLIKPYLPECTRYSCGEPYNILKKAWTA